MPNLAQSWYGRTGVDPAHGALDADQRAHQQRDERLGAAIADSLESNDRVSVSVIVMFAPPASVSARSSDLRARRAAVHSTRDTMLSALAPGDFSVRRAFETAEGVAGEVAPSGILHLLALPIVAPTCRAAIGPSAVALEFHADGATSTTRCFMIGWSLCEL